MIPLDPDSFDFHQTLLRIAASLEKIAAELAESNDNHRTVHGLDPLTVIEIGDDQ